ncbi:MAG: LysE family translocator [Pyrinomonadaceae bacterium]|nr:LysE family translocator [Sphingobacteriaceae bacterium]
MTGIIHFETFLLAGILLNLTPGNDTIFILTKSIAQGKKAGIISALGIATGSVIHTLFAALGLSIIIGKSILLYTLIKYAGAAYMLYLGYQMFIQNTQLDIPKINKISAGNYSKIYRDAIITNILNPKVALFFIAFLPQFIDSSAKNTVFPFIALGATFIVTGTIWCLILAQFSSAIFTKLKHNKTTADWLSKICGLTLISLGIKLALTDRK